jgi:hypothetical protein
MASRNAMPSDMLTWDRNVRRLLLIRRFWVRVPGGALTVSVRLTVGPNEDLEIRQA